MAAEDKNARFKSNMTIAIYPATDCEHDVDIHTIIFLMLAVVIFLRLRSVLGQRTHRRGRIPVTGILLTLTAAASTWAALSGIQRWRPLRPSAAPPA